MTLSSFSPDGFTGMEDWNGLILQSFQSSMDLGALSTQIFWESCFEAFLSPQNFVKRNLDYFQEISALPQPSWQTPHREVKLPENFSSLIKLLDFSVPEANSRKVIPTLVLPPQAGHHSYIADYSPEQSQTRTLRQSGLSEIYCIEWLGATRATRHTRIEDYIQALHFVIQKIGGRANLVGDCQGGWLAAIYAALYPETVNSLVLAGAPIDFQAGDGPIKRSVNFFAKTYPEGGMAFYRKLVAMGDGVLEGRFLITGFNNMRPGQSAERYLNLYRDIDDPEAFKRYKEMKNWYDHPQDIAGDFYLWLVKHLFRDNELIRGQLVVSGRRVDLKRITCPLFLIGGTEDHITPPEQLFALASRVGTPQEKVEKHLIEAGHIGIFMGHGALKHKWAPIGQEVARLSQINTG